MPNARRMILSASSSSPSRSGRTLMDLIFSSVVISTPPS